MVCGDVAAQSKEEIRCDAVRECYGTESKATINRRTPRKVRRTPGKDRRTLRKMCIANPRHRVAVRTLREFRSTGIQALDQLFWIRFGIHAQPHAQRFKLTVKLVAAGMHVLGFSDKTQLVIAINIVAD